MSEDNINIIDLTNKSDDDRAENVNVNDNVNENEKENEKKNEIENEKETKNIISSNNTITDDSISSLKNSDPDQDTLNILNSKKDFDNNELKDGKEDANDVFSEGIITNIGEEDIEFFELNYDNDSIKQIEKKNEKKKELKRYNDNDDDIEETVLERIVGLTEMFPKSVRNFTSSVFERSGPFVQKTYSSCRSLTWIIVTSFVILILPISVEKYRHELQKDIYKEILLGSGKNNNSGRDNAPPFPN